MNSIDSYINRLKYDSKTATTVQFDDSKYMVKGKVVFENNF